MDDKQRLREEFQEWLSAETWNWTTYATLTFSRPMRKDALRFARAWVRFIARTAGEVWGFCFQETHSDGQRLHVHCLLHVRQNLLGQPSNREMWYWWFQKFGRAQVVQYHKPQNPQGLPEMNQEPNNYPTLGNHQEITVEFVAPLASYLTKYMVKEAYQGGFDWDFYAYSSGFELTSDQFRDYTGLSATFLA